MQKYKLKYRTKSFDKEGMILEGYAIGDKGACQTLKVKAKSIYENNIDTMSKRDIYECLEYGAENEWNYLMGALEPFNEPKISLSKLEYELLKYYLEKGYKYIARDKDGELLTYKNKPFKMSIEWNGNNSLYELEEIRFEGLFSFISWKDEKPYSIENILYRCEVN